MSVKWIEVRELDRQSGKAFARVYRVEGDVATHRGCSVPLDELVSRCTDIAVRSSAFEAAFKDYVLWFKGISDNRQHRFEIKRSSPFDRMRTVGLDLETGELCRLGDFIVEYAYTADDVVSIITRSENSKIRNFQRARA